MGNSGNQIIKCAKPGGAALELGETHMSITPKKKSMPAVKTKATNNKSKKAGSTRITIQYDAGFSNNLYIRGNGAGLSWDRGVPLKNLGADEWVWETSAPCEDCEFKVLINDQRFEEGENHHLHDGTQLKYTPKF